jgi:hypothetical protein
MDRGAQRPRFLRYATNYLIDTENAVILDVEASRAVRQAEAGASRTMIDRTARRFGLKPKRLAADGAYGSAANLAWLVKKRQIEPRVRQVEPNGRHVLAIRLCLRSGAQSRHLPARQAPGAVSSEFQNPEIGRH